MANNTLVGSAAVTITVDLSKFASDAKTQISTALSSSTMRDAVTAGLDSAAADAGVAGQSAATKFAGGVTDASSTLGDAGAKAGMAVTDGISTGIDGAGAVFSEAGARGGAEFADAVGTSAAGAGDALAASVDDTAAVAASYAGAGDDAGGAYSDAVAGAIDAGAGDVADAAGSQADTLDSTGGNALAQAGQSIGDTFTDSVKESVGKLAEKAAPIATAEAAKLGTEAGSAMSDAGAASGGKFAEGLKKSFSTLASSLGPIVGVLGVGELVKSSLDAADELEGANIKIDNVFGQSGKSVQTWASGVAQSLGQSQLAAETTAGKFGAYLAGLGVPKDQASGLSEQLVTLAANMAAFNNADPAAVNAAITSALGGRTTALKQYGVTLTTAQVNQEAMTHATELGLTVTNGTIPPLNSQQKALATLYAVMDSTKNQQGALAATSDTLKAKQQQATAEFANMRAELGQELMPILASLLGILTGAIIPALEATGHWISQNSDWLKPLVSIIGGAVIGLKAYNGAMALSKIVATDFTGITQKLGAMFNSQGAQMRAATVANQAYNTAVAEGKTEAEAAAIAQGELDTAMDANPIGLVVVAIAALAAGFYYAYTHSKTFRDAVNDVGSALKKVWTDVLVPVGKFLYNDFVFQVDAAIAVVKEFMKLPDQIMALWGKVATFFTGLWGDITGAFATAGTWLLGIGEDIIGGLWTGIQFGWKIIYAWFIGWPLMLLGYYAGAVKWLESAGRDVMSGLWNGIYEIWDVQIKLLENIESTVQGWFTGAIGWLSQAGQDIITGLFSGIGTAASKTGSFVGGIATDLKNAINSALGLPLKVPGFDTHIPGVGTIGGFTLIPHLAAGGMTTGPGQFVMGDNPSGQEVALPLDSPNTTNALARALSEAASMNRGATQFSSDGAQTVTLDPESLAALMAVADLANRPVVVQIGNKVIAKAANTGNKALARIS